MTGYGKRPRSINYSVDNLRKKNKNKVKEAIKHYIFLQKRIQFEGNTKWLMHAVEKAKKRLKKYSIPIERISL